MLDELIEIEESELPPINDPKMADLAYELAKEYESFYKPRISLESEIWPACDRAFMCIRDDLPFIPSMRFVDNGMLGESDIRDAIKTARNQILQGIIPSDESWLEPVALEENDDESVLAKVKDLLISKFDEAEIQQKAQIFVDQLLARGTSAWELKWHTARSVKTVSRDLATQLRTISKTAQITDEEGNLLHEKRGKIRYWQTFYDGPIISPVDMYRLLLDPAAELGKDAEPAYIYLTFKTMTDLKNAKSRVTGENLYDEEALKRVTEWTYADYYKVAKWACYSTRFMGIDPTLEDLGKFVPVYMFYRQVRDTEEGETYIDKIFYVARSGREKEWTIIRVQDNPNASGGSPFFAANCDAWLNCPYGAGIAEKSLSAWKAKNVLAAIGLNARVLQNFPPSYYVGNVLKDDRKPKMMPGAFQEIIMRPGVGMEWIRPYPNINPENVMLGMQEEKYQSEKIIAQTGTATSALAADPSKSLTREKTATEVKQTSMDGFMSGQVLVDKLNKQTMEPIAQTMYDLLVQHSDGQPMNFVNTARDDRPHQVSLTPDELNKKRAIKIIGKRGLANKAQKLDNLSNALKILANPQAGQVVQNLGLMLQDIIFELIGGLGIPIKPEYKAKPEEIFAKEPQVQMAAVQNLIQNPKAREMLAQQLMKFPDIQQKVMQLANQISQQNQQKEETQEGELPLPPMQGGA